MAVAWARPTSRPEARIEAMGSPRGGSRDSKTEEWLCCRQQGGVPAPTVDDHDATALQAGDCAELCCQAAGTDRRINLFHKVGEDRLCRPSPGAAPVVVGHPGALTRC